MKAIALGLVLGLLVTSGCGYNRIGAPVPKKNKPVATQVADVPVATPVVGMKAAYEAVQAFAKAQYGDDFKPVMAFGDKVFDTQFKPAPGTWQFNMVGHKRGEADYIYVKIKVGPDGKAFVEPGKGGPFPDRNKQHLLPDLGIAQLLELEAGTGIVMTKGYGWKYPPTIPVSWEIRPSDRLKQMALTFKWTHVTSNKTTWFVETILNPTTGDVIENDAAHL